MNWSPETIIPVLDALNELGSPYIITGSVASNVYVSMPRGTIDADFVLEIRGNEMQRLRQRLAGQFEAEPQMAFETVTAKVQHKFRHRQTKFLVEVFEARLDDPHERSRLARRIPATLHGRPTFFPTAEDVVVQKLRWFKQIRRAKDRDDVRNVMIHQWDSLDWPYIERWCDEHSTLPALTEIRREVDALLKEAQGR